jgi:pimeloyl-ACP methyl ester carboxylesterase
VVENGFVTAPDGLRLHVEVSGSRGKPLIVPGTGNEADFMELARNHEVVFFDIRNRGRSAAVPAEGRVGVPIEIDDIDRVRAYFSLERCSLFGWSYVALVAALYAARHPERVDRLILSCPPAARDVSPSATRPRDPDDDTAVLHDNYADPATFARAARRATAQRMMAVPGAAERLKSDPGAMENEWPDHVAEALTRVRATFPPGFDLRPQLRSITAFTLVLHGEYDAIPIASSRELTASIPNARLVVVSGVAHFPHVERPDEFFRHVDTFLSGQWPDDAEICN